MQDMVWTIGHSDRTVAEFITAVSAIAAGAYVVDVRSCPYSRYVPQFNREPLRAALRAAGLHYVFMGAELGAQRRELEAYELGQVSFTKTMQLPLFQQGMARLQKGLSLGCPLVLMCAERDPLTCHRFALVARALCAHGVQVAHLVGDKVLTQAQAETELIARYQTKLDLFAPYSEQLDQAYALLNSAIGFRWRQPDSTALE